jgi:hypothetical protein
MLNAMLFWLVTFYIDAMTQEKVAIGDNVGMFSSLWTCNYSIHVKC